MSLPEPMYLGDGVYVQTDDFGNIAISTRTHQLDAATNIIYLEFEVQIKLVDYIECVRQARAGGGSGQT